MTLRWTDFSCQRIELVGKRHAVASFHHELAFANHVHEFEAAKTACAERNDLKPSIGWGTLLMARLPCFTICLRFLPCRILIGMSRSLFSCTSPAWLAPFLSI